jgi:hypothetical protein
MEKGGAKYWGTYKIMSGGWMTEAMYAMTGMPQAEIRASDSNLW